MASPRFIAKTEFGAAEPLTLNGAPVLRRHEELTSLLIERGAAGAARLFAEPIIGTGSVSWYAEGSGEAQPFSALSAARRAEAEAQLRGRLEALEPLLDDPRAGPLLRHALALGIDEPFYALDDTVVIIGWGMLPAGTPGGEAAVVDRVRAMLARYSPTLAGAGSGWLAARAAPPSEPP
ncbi:MAG: hypothetical protein K2X74_17580, partial [Acetobacteraceae bacterium]|nr:hypothetical protein [Acetobacteraceae bacterium]